MIYTVAKRRVMKGARGRNKAGHKGPTNGKTNAN
jgi:hypothetical protein